MTNNLDPVVICGLAVRLPGGVRNPEDFWQLLINKKSGLIPIPRSRFNVDGFYSPYIKTGTIQNRDAYILDYDITDFDASHFSCAEREISVMDAAQRQLLEITKECLDSAGETDWRGKRVGCYVGSFANDWQDELTLDPHSVGNLYGSLYHATGSLDFLQPNRVSYEYEWTGPSILIKTGCSSTLVALHLAAEAVANGACCSAMVLGCNVITSVTTYVTTTESGILSNDGKSKTFDASADGYGRGEAVNAVYIKRLSDALHDGNPVRAVIRASATNNDGKGGGALMSPNPVTQEQLIRYTYQKAGISDADLRRTAFFECHGTGTATGDPLEAEAIANVWRDHGGVKIGGVKPNVGHSEGAAGLTSVIKAVLALENKTIPPNIYFKNPNPKIQWKEAKLSVATEPEAWPEDRDALVSVNSFGIAGSNAHLILESYDNWVTRRQKTSPNNSVSGSGITVPSYSSFPSSSGPHLLLFSASHPDSLKEQVKLHKAYVQSKGPDSIENICYTLAHHRERLPWRSFAMVDDQGSFTDTVSAARRVTASSSSMRIVFVFTGQGSQWAGMGKKLLQESSVFRETIRRLDRWLKALPAKYRPDWTVGGQLVKSAEDSKVGQRGYSHACIAAVQIAFADVLSKSLKVTASAVTGHSAGEAAAAYAAGILTAEQAMAVAYFRGWVLLHGKVPVGSMAAVNGVARSEIERFLVPGVVVGCENSPISCTLSGDPVAIQYSIDQLRRRYTNLETRMLQVETSYHSPNIKPLGEPYQELMTTFFGDVPPKAPRIMYFSSVTGKLETGGEGFGPDYWRRSFVQPVLFNSAVSALLKSNANNLFIEVGPHAALQAPIREIVRSAPETAAYPNSNDHVATLSYGEDGHVSLLRLCGQLFGLGVPFETSEVVANDKERLRVLTDMPTYPWRHNVKYLTTPVNSLRYRSKHFPRHQLLGDRVLEGNDIEPAWRNFLDVKAAAWLPDHKVNGRIVFPAAGYAGMVGEAIRQIHHGSLDAYTIRDMNITTALMLSKNKQTEIYTRLQPEGDEKSQATWYNFRIMSYSSEGQHWISHARGFIRSGTGGPPPESLVANRDKAHTPFPRSLDTDVWYKAVKDKLGIEWASAFQGLEDPTSSVSTEEANATVYDYTQDPERYLAHPALLDSMLQISLLAMSKGLARKMDSAELVPLPTHIGWLGVLGEQELRGKVYGAVDQPDGDSPMKGRSAIFTDKGRLSAYAEDIGFTQVRKAPQLLVKNNLPLGSHDEWHKDVTLLNERMPLEKALAGVDGDQLSYLISLLGCKYPDSRILQIGTVHPDHLKVAHAALHALHPSQNARFYSTYSYACIDQDHSSNLQDVRAQLPEDRDVTVCSLDEVSLTAGGVDVIMLSAETLLADDELVQYELEGLSELVAPSGRLVVYHVNKDHDTMARVKEQLEDNMGFVVYPHSTTTTGLVLAERDSNNKDAEQNLESVTILVSDTSWGRELANSYSEMKNAKFVFRGRRERTLPIPQHGEAGGIILSLLDLDTDEAPVVSSLDEKSFAPFIASLCQFTDESSSLIWALPVVHTSDCQNPYAAMTYGVVRTLRHEEPKLDITLVEMDRHLPSALTTICRGLNSRRKGTGRLRADYEYAVMDGFVEIPRRVWFGLKKKDHDIAVEPKFRPDVTYFLAGGLGGLGRSVATWMLEHGARSLLFLSRNAGSTKHMPFIEELKAYPGCQVAAVSGDVANYDDVKKAIQEAPSAIGGVMQMSLLLRDKRTSDMNFEEWDAVIKPRINGTVNIDQALLEAQMRPDFFVVFGSGGGTTGFLGQANYNATNTFLDAWVEHRHSRGLPASIIDIAAVGDVGYVAEQEELHHMFDTGGWLLIRESDVLDGLALSVANQHAQDGYLASFGIGGFSTKSYMDPTNRVSWKRDVRFGVSTHFPPVLSSSATASPSSASQNLTNGLSGVVNGDAHENGHLHDDDIERYILLARSDSIAARNDPAVVAGVAKLIASGLSSLLLRPVEDFSLTDGLKDINVDSIVSIELVDWIQIHFKIAMSSVEVISSISLMDLADKILVRLSKS